MKGPLFAGILITLVIAGTAEATTAGKDMAAAMRALHYPKTGALKVGCHTVGTTSGSFHCKATYKHHHTRWFYAKWAVEGGWVCAGTRLTGCRTLRHGFTRTATNDAADLAARGWDGNTGQPTGFCQPAGTLKWACGFTTGTVTITMKKARGGYTITAST